MTKTKQIKPPTERRQYFCEIYDSENQIIKQDFFNARNENEAAAKAMGSLRFDIAKVMVEGQQVYPWEKKPRDWGPGKSKMATAMLQVYPSHETLRRLRLMIPEGERSAFIDRVVAKALDEL